jgi:hypothetical protein
LEVVAVAADGYKHQLNHPTGNPGAFPLVAKESYDCRKEWKVQVWQESGWSLRLPKRSGDVQMSKLLISLDKYKDKLIGGNVLAIDPSSGSAKSQPGYAVWQAGELMDSGIIRIQPGGELSNRLFHLADSLRREFQTPDLLITEGISIIMSGTGFSGPSMISLQRAIGVVQSCFDCPCLEVAPRTWRKYIPEGYIKTDENDAIMIGATPFLELDPTLEPIPEIFWEQLGGRPNAKTTEANTSRKNPGRKRKKD